LTNLIETVNDSSDFSPVILLQVERIRSPGDLLPSFFNVSLTLLEYDFSLVDIVVQSPNYSVLGVV